MGTRREGLSSGRDEQYVVFSVLRDGIGGPHVLSSTTY